MPPVTSVSAATWRWCGGDERRRGSETARGAVVVVVEKDLSAPVARHRALRQVGSARRGHTEYNSGMVTSGEHHRQHEQQR